MHGNDRPLSCHWGWLQSVPTAHPRSVPALGEVSLSDASRKSFPYGVARLHRESAACPARIVLHLQRPPKTFSYLLKLSLYLGALIRISSMATCPRRRGSCRLALETSDTDCGQEMIIDDAVIYVSRACQLLQGSSLCLRVSSQRCFGVVAVCALHCECRRCVRRRLARRSRLKAQSARRRKVYK
jgi:hypothetical protein